MMLRLVLALFIGLLLPLACTTPGSAPERDRDREVIGRPPPPDEDDPFFARALPAEAVPAEPRGQIGRPAPEPERPPEPEPTPMPDVQPDRQACFSCVRICPLDDSGRPNCSAEVDDLICGWGSHRDHEQAARSAQAHCDATLDMARQLPTYSEIAGQCPPATCQ